MSQFEQHYQSKTLPALPELRERDARLEALKAMVGKLAHDFNNFLVPLLGYVTLIKEEVPAASAALKYATTMESAARKTEHLLDNLLLAVRPHRHFSPTLVDLKSLIEHALESWQSSIPSSAHVSVRADLQACTLFVDEAQWRKLLDQLLSNARFALATGGLLEVTLREKQITPQDVSNLNVTSSNLFELRIKDSGFGMTPEVLRRACEPFFTTRTLGHAGGLGLTIVHSIVQMSGGQIQIESAEDEGTTVTLWIPLKTPNMPSPTTLAAHPSSRRERGRRILLVEDDPLVREVIRSCLQKTNLEVDVAVDGEEGFKMYQRHSNDLALIISDVTMPKMNGIELFKAIRERDRQTRIILMSGDAESPAGDALADLGGERPLLLKKPFTLRAFNQIVRTHLDPA